MSIYKHFSNEYDFESTLESSFETAEEIEIEDFEEFHEEMVKESALDIARCEGGMYIAEQLIENAIFTAEDHEVEHLIENAIGDFFSKLKESLMKLWNKIKAWFKHIYEAVKRFFTSGKELVKSNKKQIIDAAKKHSSVEIKCYKWNPDALAAKATSMIMSTSSAAETAANKAYKDEMAGDNVDRVQSKKDIIKSIIDSEKISDISKQLKEAAKDGSKDKYTVGELQIDTKFLATIENSSKIIKATEAGAKAIDVSMRKALSDIDDASKKAISEASTENVAKIKKAAAVKAELTRYASTLRTSIVKSYTSEVKTMATQMTSVIKSLLNKASYKDNVKKKDVKEGAFADIYDMLGY